MPRKAAAQNSEKPHKSSRIEKVCEELIEQCQNENRAIFIALETSKGYKYMTVTPEEVDHPGSKEYNALIRAVSGFDRTRYE